MLTVYREDAREKRLTAVQAIQHEAARLRRIIQELGQAGASAPAAAPPPPVTPVPAAPPAPSGFEATLREAVALAQSALEGQRLTVELRVPAGTAPPRCPPPNVSRAVVAMLQGIAAVTAPDTVAVLRCEKKPVLLRGRDGTEVKRDFLMLALAHKASLPSEDQQRIVQGADPGPLGETTRLVREMGGFVRFAPLPGGGLETRLFLPAA
jgi:hypothetical protein